MAEPPRAPRHLAESIRARGGSEWHLILRYLLIGAMATLVHTAVSVSLLLFTPISPLYGHVAGFLTGFVVASTGHARYTFKLETGHGAAIARFFLVALAALIISEAALAHLIGAWGVAPLKAQLAAIGVSVACSFTLARLWAF